MNPIKLQHYFPIIQNINHFYQAQKHIKDRFWQFADRDFLYHINGQNAAQYHLFVNRYIKTIIQKRMNQELEYSMQPVIGKILALLIDEQHSDGMAEAETDSFFDACDTSPSEFWITFENGILYSFIPNEFISFVDRGKEVVIGDSLYWVSDMIYYRSILKSCDKN